MVRLATIALTALLLSGCCKDETDSTPCVEDCGTLRDKSAYFDYQNNRNVYVFIVDLSCNGERVEWQGYGSHNHSVLIGDQLCRSEVW